MRYAPPGLCLNDFAVLASPAGRPGWRVLHLQGPPALPFDAAVLETSYGTATSADLLHWEPGPPVFGVGLPGAFDDAAIWTMSLAEIPGGMVMFYTGVTEPAVPNQAIGLAYSDRRDGTGWRRAGRRPVVEADPRWYRTGPGMAWRDPFVVDDRDRSGRWVMVVCARAADMPPEAGGCVGWATSDDLEHWEVQPPLLLPGDISELECPVLERDEFGWLLLGSIGPEHAIHAWRAPELTGPWTRLGRIAPVGAYAPRLTTADGARMLLHTERRRAGLTDTGELVRGVLAQPKLCLPDPGLGLRLRWWPGAERALDSGSESLGAGDGVARIAVDEPERVTITLAGRRTIEIGCTSTEVSLGYPGLPPLWREPVREPARESVRVLRYGEFTEVYLDDTWVLSAPVYSGPTPRVSAVADGAAVDVTCRACFGPADRRDDLSAVGARVR